MILFIPKTQTDLDDHCPYFDLQPPMISHDLPLFLCSLAFDTLVAFL